MKVKTLTGLDKVRNKNGGIKDEQGELMSEPGEIKKRWKRYIEVLYNKDGKPSEEIFNWRKKVQLNQMHLVRIFWSVRLQQQYKR